MNRRGQSSRSHHSQGAGVFIQELLLDPRAKLVAILLFLGLIIFGIVRIFQGDAPVVVADADFYVTKSSSGVVAIVDAKGTNREVSTKTPFSHLDGAIKVSQGNATLQSTGVELVLDRTTELDINNTDKNKIELKVGGLWVDSSKKRGDIFVLKNFQVVTNSQDTTMLFIQNAVSSTIAVISGSAALSTNSSSLTLNAGDMMTLFAQDVAKSDLSDKVQPISDVTTSHGLFVLKGGAEILANSQSSKIALSEDGTGVVLMASSRSQSGVLLNSSGSSSSGSTLSEGANYIEIISPKDGASIAKQYVSITGKVYSSNVAKVLINEKQALVSSDMTFSLSDVALPLQVNTVLYKAISPQGKVLDNGYITIKNPSAQKSSLLSDQKDPPVADKKLYYISSPSSNPYQTTEKTVKIQGIVPKGKVKYVEVNGFRLKKFVPYSSSWLYTASYDGGNLKSDLNLYRIYYYGQNEELLGTTLYSIFLESNEQISPLSGATR